MVADNQTTRKQDTEVMNDGLVRWDDCPGWGVAVEYDPSLISYLKDYHLDDDQVDELIHKIACNGNNTNVPDVIGSLWLDDFQWTTGIDFGSGAYGGGYDISFSWGDCEAVLSVLVEWHDDRAIEAGHDERKDESECIRIGLETLNLFLDEIQAW